MLFFVCGGTHLIRRSHFLVEGDRLLNSKWYFFSWALLAAAIKSFVVINAPVTAVAISWFGVGIVNYVS
ncbi:MAG: hypothetical protein WBA39_07880 [Rivularia sp. (in: cyanobacteria)]